MEGPLIETRPHAPKRMPQGLLVTALLIIIIWGAASAQRFLVPVCLAALLAFLMSPVVRWLRRNKTPEILAIILAAIILLLPLLTSIWLVVWQGQSLVQEFPRIVLSLNASLLHFAQGALARRLHLTEVVSLQSLIGRLSHDAGQGISLLIGGLRTLLDATSQTALVLVFAIVMLASREHLWRSCERILAQLETIQSAPMLNAVTKLIERFLMARLLIVVIIGALAIGVLLIFGIPYALLLGALLGVMTLVPVIGFILSLIPIVIVTLATGHGLLATLALLGALVIVSAIESHILTPKFVGHRLNINALATFLGLFAGGLLWGIWGMLLSVPFLGVLRIAFSAFPSLQPWGDLLAEREERNESLLGWRRTMKQPSA